MNFQTAADKLGNRDSRKLQNNTYLVRHDAETIAVRLHATDVVTFRANGDTVLNSGGWRTVTTKDRMNTYADVSIHSVKGTWRICRTGDWDSAVLYDDGMVIPANGPIVGVNPDANKAIEKRYNKMVRAYVNRFCIEIENNGMEWPNAGGCLYCQVALQDSTAKDFGGPDHILSHLDERYLVPSLLYVALREQGRTPEQVSFIWQVFMMRDIPRRNSGTARLALRAYFRRRKASLLEIMEASEATAV